MAIWLGSVHPILGAFLALCGLTASASENPGWCQSRWEDCGQSKVKVFAQVGLGSGSDWKIGPLFRSGPQLVFRSAEELAANADPTKAKDSEFQKQIEAQYAKLLRVEAIDWRKQMVVAAGGTVYNYNRRAFFQSFEIQGKQMVVQWRITEESEARRSECHDTRCVALIERFDGPVLFNPNAADKAKDLKVLVKMGFAGGVSLGPLRDDGQQPEFRNGREPKELVIRNVEELAANCNPMKAKDPAFQKEVEVQLAKFLKVGAIDWNKKMVVAVWLHIPPQRAPRPPVDFVSFQVKGGRLTIRWILNGPGRMYPSPSGIAMIERFAGPILFNPPAPK